MINEPGGFDLYINRVNDRGNNHYDAEGTLNGTPVTISFDSNKKLNTAGVKSAFEAAKISFHAKKGVNEDGVRKFVLKTNLESKELKNLIITYPETLQNLLFNISSGTAVASLKKTQQKEKMYTPEEALETLQALKKAIEAKASSFKLEDETVDLSTAIERFVANKSIAGLSPKEAELKEGIIPLIRQLDKNKTQQKAVEASTLLAVDAKLNKGEAFSVINALRKAIEKDIYLLVSRNEAGQPLSVKTAIEKLNNNTSLAELAEKDKDVKKQLEELVEGLEKFRNRFGNVESLIKAYLDLPQDEEVALLVKERAEENGVADFNKFFVDNYKNQIETGPLLAKLNEILNATSNEDVKAKLRQKIQAIMLKNGIFFPVGGF